MTLGEPSSETGEQTGAPPLVFDLASEYVCSTCGVRWRGHHACPSAPRSTSAPNLTGVNVIGASVIGNAWRAPCGCIKSFLYDGVESVSHTRECIRRELRQEIAAEIEGCRIGGQPSEGADGYNSALNDAARIARGAVS